MIDLLLVLLTKLIQRQYGELHNKLVVTNYALHFL